jgi:branched-subunit amino acid transport protein
MTMLLAVVTVGAASLLFRLAPLLGAELIPDRVVRLASHAGLAVLAGLATRAVLLHEDPTVEIPGPLLAAAALAPALYLTLRGRSALLAIASAAATYLLLSTLLSTAVGSGN